MPVPSAPPMESPQEEVHLLERKKCDQCGYETNTETERKYHIETQHGARQKDYRGVKATNFPVGHAQWAASRNENTLQYKCMECNRVFGLESMLNEHISRAHNTTFSHM